MDFAVNMGQDVSDCVESPENWGWNIHAQVSTRLMIVKGAFECLSMAIYGDVVDELSPPRITYEPGLLPTHDPIPLSSALDPANARDPTKLARQLLDLIPEAPPLPLIIRLMFCLKPSNEDWDLPDFPYLFSDLEQLTEETSIDDIFRLTARPLSDVTKADSLAELSQKLVQGLGPPVSWTLLLAEGALTQCHGIERFTVISSGWYPQPCSMSTS